MSLSNLRLRFLQWKRSKDQDGSESYTGSRSDSASLLLSSQLLHERLSDIIKSRSIFRVLTTVELRNMIFSHLAPGDIRNLCKDLLLFIPRRDVVEWLSPLRLIIPDRVLLSRLSREGYKLTLLSASKDLLMHGSKANPSDNFTILPIAILVATKAGSLVWPDNSLMDTLEINHTSSRIFEFSDSAGKNHSTRAMTVDCWFGGQIALWMALSTSSIIEPITLSPRILTWMNAGRVSARSKRELPLYYHDLSGKISGPISRSKRTKPSTDLNANSLCIEFLVKDDPYGSITATVPYYIPYVVEES